MTAVLGVLSTIALWVLGIVAWAVIVLLIIAFVHSGQLEHRRDRLLGHAEEPDIGLLPEDDEDAEEFEAERDGGWK